MYSTVDSIVVGHYVGDNALASVGSAAPPFIRSMLIALNTPASILDACTAYLKILMYGVAGMAYYNILSGILRGMGDSFSALIYLLIATVLNIFLDIYFVAGLNMGVAVTQSLSGVMRGAGDTVTPMLISLITTIIIRIPVAYGLSYLTRTPDLPVGRFESIPVSLLICWLMGAVLTTIFYKVGRWKKTSLQ